MVNKQVIIPSYKEKFIDLHIKYFRLNDMEYKIHQILNFIKNVIDNDGKIQKNKKNR
jgi:hypothetical protein